VALPIPWNLLRRGNEPQVETLRTQHAARRTTALSRRHSPSVRYHVTNHDNYLDHEVALSQQDVNPEKEADLAAIRTGLLAANSRLANITDDSAKNARSEQRQRAELAKKFEKYAIGDLVLRIREDRKKFETRYSDLVFIITRVFTTTITCERLDGRRDYSGYPASSANYKKVLLSPLGMTIYLRGIGLDETQSECRMRYAFELAPSQGASLNDTYGALKIPGNLPPVFGASDRTGVCGKHYLFWNCDGIIASLVRLPEFIFTLLRSRPRMILLQEVKTNNKNLATLCQLVSDLTQGEYIGFFWGDNGYSGIGGIVSAAICLEAGFTAFSNSRVDSSAERLATFVDPAAKVVILNLYTMNSKKGLENLNLRITEFDRRVTEEILSTRLAYPGYSLLVGGDFNAVRDLNCVKDIHPTLSDPTIPSLTDAESSSFSRIAREAQLVITSHVEGRNNYTFFPRMHNIFRRQGIRLDYILSSQPDRFTSITVIKTGRQDHQVLQLALKSLPC
jgi:exonuclease III